MSILINWADSINLESKIMKKIENEARNKFENENLLSLITVVSAVIEFLVMFCGGFLSISIFIALVFAIGYAIAVLIK